VFGDGAKNGSAQPKRVQLNVQGLRVRGGHLGQRRFLLQDLADRGQRQPEVTQGPDEIEAVKCVRSNSR